MLKRSYHFILIGIILVFIGNVQPVHASDEGMIDVLVGYENEEGKNFIIEHSHEVKHSFEHIPFLSVIVEEANIPLLEESSDVTYIKENKAVELSNNEQINQIELPSDQVEAEFWNIDLIGAKYAWLEGYTGKGAKIAIIDTGIAPHSELSITGGVSTVDYTDSWIDDHGHGTHVGGVIAGQRDDHGIVGVAPDAELYAVKALDQDGEGNLDDVLRGIDWAIANGMDIINLSLGMQEEDPLLEEILNQAYESGILIVGASGNKGEANSVLYPAKHENTIAVSAVDARLNLAPFSSTGAAVEFSAPGFSIISTYLDGSYGVANGTSQAVPHVVGMLALLSEKYPNKNHVELREALTQYVQDLGAAGRDSQFGHGFITYVPDDQTPPSEVTDFGIDEVTAESVAFRWKNPTDEDLDLVEIYLDEEWIQTMSSDEEPVYKIENLTPDQAYELTFYTIDQFGNRSDGITETITTMDALVEDEELEEEQHIEDYVLGTVKEETIEEESVVSSSNTQKQETIHLVEKEPTSTNDTPKKVEWSAEVIYPETKEKESNIVQENKEQMNKVQEDDKQQEVKQEMQDEKEENFTAERDRLLENDEVEEQIPLTEEDAVEKQDEEENEQEDQGFIGKIIDFIVTAFHSFFTWFSNLFR